MSALPDDAQPCVVATTRHGPTGDSLEESLYRTVRTLLDRVGLRPGDIDHIAIASSDGLDGRAISSMVTGPAVGVYRHDIINSSSSGEHALILACLRIMAGRSRTALVVNWGHPSEAPIDAVQRLELEPFFHRGLGGNYTIFHGLQAAAYLARTGLDPAVADEVLRKNGLAADGGDEVVAWPLRARHLPPQVDGSVAVLVASAAWARSRGLPAVLVTGIGWNTSSYWERGAALGRLDSLAAAAMAIRQAGIPDLTAVDFIETTDVTPFHELMAYEALGLCGEGEAADLLRSGATAADGATPVNRSGGLHAGAPPFAHGLDRVAVATQALLAGQGRQALVHAASGLAAQNNSVFVLRSE